MASLVRAPAAVPANPARGGAEARRSRRAAAPSLAAARQRAPHPSWGAVPWHAEPHRWGIGATGPRPRREPVRGGVPARAVDASVGAPLPPPSQKVLWWRAIKLPIYTVAAVPLAVGAANAYLLHGVFLAGRFSLFALASVMVIAWLNLSNDGYDAETSVDETKPESIVNLTGSKRRVVVIANVLLGLGLGLFAVLVNGIGDPRVFWLLAAAIGCGYVYQCPPFRLSYKGLGEPLCFAAFGPLATSAFFLAQAPGEALWGAWGRGLLASCVLVGATTTAILFCSHFHQIEGDRAAGKFSPLVRMGTDRAKDVLTAVVVGFYAFYAGAVTAGALPATCAAAAVATLPVAARLVSYVRAHHADPARIFMGKYFAVRWHAAHGAALAVGLAAARAAGLG